MYVCIITYDNKVIITYDNKVIITYDNKVIITYDNKVIITYDNKVIINYLEWGLFGSSSRPQLIQQAVHFQDFLYKEKDIFQMSSLFMLKTFEMHVSYLVHEVEVCGKPGLSILRLRDPLLELPVCVCPVVQHVLNTSCSVVHMS